MPHPPATTVIYVRHGVTATTGKVLPGRAKGLFLSARGREQAEAVASRLTTLAKKPTALYVSPLERTRETAAPIAKALGLRAVADKGLLECDFGSWTGAKLTTLMKKPEWRSVQHAPSTFCFPDGESFTQMHERIWSTTQRLVAKHRGETIICVSHADPIKAAVTNALGVPLDLFQRTSISPCSMSVVNFSAHGPHVLAVNVTSGDGPLEWS